MHFQRVVYVLRNCKSSSISILPRRKHKVLAVDAHDGAVLVLALEVVEVARVVGARGALPTRHPFAPEFGKFLPHGCKSNRATRR